MTNIKTTVRKWLSTKKKAKDCKSLNDALIALDSLWFDDGYYIDRLMAGKSCILIDKNITELEIKIANFSLKGHKHTIPLEPYQEEDLYGINVIERTGGEMYEQHIEMSLQKHCCHNWMKPINDPEKIGVWSDTENSIMSFIYDDKWFRKCSKCSMTQYQYSSCKEWFFCDYRTNTNKL